ncbi:hypothetical protein H4Q26_006473 [Puccinia striiformis f. sp. tritici PST-130]|nr:hypothetical protein H4Q26_006473 [Puccinia striiformis f. sp. tritici PST-130]
MDRTRVFIPPSFAVPKKPANYIAPRAWTPAGTSQPSTPAGRSSARPAGVAGIADDTLFPELDDQSAAALEELDHLVSVSSLSLMDDEREAAPRALPAYKHWQPMKHQSVLHPPMEMKLGSSLSEEIRYSVL